MHFILALDLDDTLLNGNRQISDTTIQYITNLDKNKYSVVLSTGRPFISMKDFYKKLGLDTAVICNNGALVFNPSDKNFPMFKKTLNLDEFINFFKQTKPFLNHALYSTEEKTYVYNNSPKLSFLIPFTKKEEIIEGPFDKTCDIPPYGAIFIVKKQYINDFDRFLFSTKNIDGRCLGYDNKNAVYELSIPNVNKAIGLQFLLDNYKKNAITIAFGDGINDLELIDYVDYGIAMKNSNEELLKIAKYKTDFTNNEDGVIKYLDLLLKKIKDDID